MLRHSRGPTGSFTAAGAAGLFEQLKQSGLSTTEAKNRLARPTLAQILKDTPALHETDAADKQRARVLGRVEAKQANHPINLHTVKKIAAVGVFGGVQGRSCEKGDGGVLRYREKHMKLAIVWVGFRDDIVCEKLGITWQPASAFTDGSGDLRDQVNKFNDFMDWYEQQPVFLQKGWPWKKPSTGNDKDIILTEPGAGAQKKWRFLKEQPDNCLSHEARAI